MSPIDFLAPFHAGQHTRESLVPAIDGVLADGDSVVRALPFYCEMPAADWVQLSSPLRHCVTPLVSGGGVHHFRCDLPADGGSGGAARGIHRFFILDHAEYPHVHVLLTLGPGPFFDWLRRRVAASYPAAVTTFVTHRTLRRLLEAFVVQHRLTRLVIKRASYRIRLGEHEQGARGRVIPLVVWPEMELQEAFDWLHDQNGWFQSLQFEARRGHQTLATVSFSRQGVTRTDRLFAQVFAAFVDPVCKRIHENVGLFGQRSRRDRADLSARPLVIDLGPGGIAEDDQRQRFVRAMGGLSNASVSVLHGNPYVHLSVLDYYDGSVFDVWVLSDSEITIVPQMKGTMPAVKRLVNHVFDVYAEGRIRDPVGVQS